MSSRLGLLVAETRPRERHDCPRATQRASHRDSLGDLCPMSFPLSLVTSPALLPCFLGQISTSPPLFPLPALIRARPWNSPWNICCGLGMGSWQRPIPPGGRKSPPRRPLGQGPTPQPQPGNSFLAQRGSPLSSPARGFIRQGGRGPGIQTPWGAVMGASSCPSCPTQS